MVTRILNCIKASRCQGLGTWLQHSNSCIKCLLVITFDGVDDAENFPSFTTP